MAKTDKTSNVYIDGKQAGKTLSELRKEARQLNNELNQLAPGTEEYRKKMQELGGTKKILKEHRDELRKVEGSYEKVKQSMGGIKDFIGGFLGANLIQKGISTIINGSRDWIKTNAQLSTSLSTLESITGATAADLEFYKKEAIEMGRTTTLTATQVVDAMRQIGASKPELLSNREALSDVTEESIRLAEAARMEVVPAAVALTGALNQWGAGAEDAGRFTNVLAAGSKNGAADIQMLGESIDKSGAVMAGYNVSIEEGVGLLETLAERNITGAEAGTNLRNILLKMQGLEVLPQDALNRLESYGVNIDKVTDSATPLNERLAEMSKISEDATTMMRVFGIQNTVAATAILKNTGRVQELTEAVTDTNTALEQQKINTDNLEGDLKALGSAWEGVQLTIGSGESVLRKLTQAGTSALQWITNFSNALKDFDLRKINTELLKLLNTFIDLSTVALNIIPGFQTLKRMLTDVIAESIRMNSIISDTIDSMKEEQRTIDILTFSLKENNNALKDGNLTEEQAAKVREENAEIIDRLNTQFPELTKNIDLSTASNKELVKWQEEASRAILETAIAEAKAAEQKRLINAIIEETIELRKQEIKEAQRWAVTNWFADIFADDAEDMRKNIDKTKNQLLNLEDDFLHVEETIKGLDLNFSVDFQVATESIEKQISKVRELEKAIVKAKQAGSDKQVTILESQLKAERKVLEKAEADKRQYLDQQLSKEKAKEVAAAEKATEEIKKINEKAQKEREKAIEELQKKLESLIDFEEKQVIEKNRRIQLLNKENDEKELLELQFKIDDKYKKEIESARALANETGKIGEEAAEKLKVLELLKKEELEHGKSLILKKYRDIEEKEEIEYIKKRQVAIQRAEDAVWNVKMMNLQAQLQELGSNEINARKVILEEIRQLEKERAETQLLRKKEALRIELEDELIERGEFDALIEELEVEHQQRLTEIHKEAIEQRNELTQGQIDNTIAVAQMAVNAFSALINAQSEASNNAIEQDKKKRIDALNAALSANRISQEEYDSQMEAIEQKADQRRKEAMLEQFEKEKKLALVQAGIDLASAIMTAIAQYGPPPSPMGIAAIASAGVIGGVQMGIIASKKAPQFAEGGYTTVTGADDGRKYNARIKGKARAGMLTGGPQLVLANERGPEYFIPNPLLNNPQVIDHVRAIENIRVRQFAEGGSTAPIPDTTASNTNIQSTNDFSEITVYLRQNGELMIELMNRLADLEVVIGDDKIDQLMTKMIEIDKIKS